MAEKIEKQTRYAAELCNMDVRQDQRCMDEHDIFPCGDRDESRFSPDFDVPLSMLGMQDLEILTFTNNGAAQREALR